MKNLKGYKVRTLDSIIEEIFAMNEAQIDETLNEMREVRNELSSAEVQGTISADIFEKEWELTRVICDLLCKAKYERPAKQVKTEEPKEVEQPKRVVKPVISTKKVEDETKVLVEKSKDIQAAMDDLDMAKTMGGLDPKLHKIGKAKLQAEYDSIVKEIYVKSARWKELMEKAEDRKQTQTQKDEKRTNDAKELAEKINKHSVYGKSKNTLETLKPKVQKQIELYHSMAFAKKTNGDLVLMNKNSQLVWIAYSNLMDRIETELEKF